MNLLSIQSQVVYGHVGNTAAVPALQRLGHEVWALPTAILSFHPGHDRPAGQVLPATEVAALAAALDRKGMLAACDGLLTGWLGSAETAAEVLQVRGRLRRANPDAVWLCDPVIGDLPKGLYVAPDLVAAFRDRLLPMADIATPNAFEMEQLSGHRVHSLADALDAATILLDRGTGCVVCTSLSRADGRPGVVESLAVTKQGAWLCQTPKLNEVPQGAGDLFAAMFLARLLKKRAVKKALIFAVAATYGVLRASAAQQTDPRLPREMHLIAALEEIARPSHDPWVQQVA